MGFHHRDTLAAGPLLRPKLLIDTARIGARLYRRTEDLVPALGERAALRIGGAAIVARLRSAEAECEEMRRRRAPGYRAQRHVQVLSALLAEAGSAEEDAYAKASGSDALRVAT